MAKVPDAPTADEARELADAQRKHWQRQADKNDVAHDLYHNEHAVESKEREANTIIDPYIYRGGRFGELLDHMTGILEVRPQHSVDPFGIGNKAEGHAEDLERWANQIRWVIEAGSDKVNHLVTHEVLLYGYSFAIVLPLPQAWRKMPRQKDYVDSATYNKAQKDFGLTAPPPIAIWHGSAQTAKPVLHGSKVVKWIDLKKVTYAWLKGRYSLDLPNVRDVEAEIEVCEYLDDTWQAVYCWTNDGDYNVEARKPWRHRMPVEEGEAPVVLYEGLTSSDMRPGYRWRGVLETGRDAFVAEDFALSRLLTIIRAYYMPTANIHLTQPYSAELLSSVLREREYKIGGTNFFFGEERFELMQNPGELPDAVRLLEQLAGRIEHQLPAVLQGIIPGQSSGYEYNQARNQALNRLAPIQERLAEGDKSLMGLDFGAVEAISTITGRDEKVYIRERTDRGTEAIGVSAEDVRDYASLIRVEREAQLPEDELANLDAAMKAYQFGLPWADCVKTYLHRPDPDKLKEQRMAEDLEQAPALLQKTQEAILHRLGVIASQEQGISPEQVQQMVNQGQPIPVGLAQAMGIQPSVSMAPKVGPETMPTPPSMGPGGMPATGQAGMGGAPPPSSAPPPPRANPRAGQRTRPTGPRRKARGSSVSGAST